MLVATPDEERESRGMRSLRDALPGLVRDFDIEIAGGINLDVTSDQGDGSEGRAVYAGTIGKLLPFALVIGCSSHASYPFEGVSAQAMAAGILARLEGNAPWRIATTTTSRRRRSASRRRTCATVTK